MHNCNFPFESCSLKMHGLAPGLQRLAGAVQPQVPVNAMNMEERWSLSQVRDGKQTNKPLIFFRVTLPVSTPFSTGRCLIFCLLLRSFPFLSPSFLRDLASLALIL